MIDLSNLIDILICIMPILVMVIFTICIILLSLILALFKERKNYTKNKITLKNQKEI